MNQIAVLLTCHNRKDKTLECLNSLYNQEGLDRDFKFEVFLVDDGSTDGTAEEVRVSFPIVQIIKGDGSLFWNRGMHLAWETAANNASFDFYFWLNDDTILDRNAFSCLFETYKQAKEVAPRGVIITTACRANYNDDCFSYGGRTDIGPAYPNDDLQECKYINGNAVLIPQNIFKELGNLSNDYTHGMGDYDYGLRALKANFSLYTTKTYLATCPPNKGIPGWCNPTLPLKKRWDLLHSPRGLNIKEYIRFRKNFWGSKWILFAIKAYAKMISPTLYQYILKK
jgi:GT2 family glycosyltransferase